MMINLPFSDRELTPQEERIEIKQSKKNITIGLPKESYLQERRICLTPDAISVLVNNGHQIITESGAGEGANFTDKQYTNAGARVTHDTKEVFESEIVLKVAPLTSKEIEMMKHGGTLISSLQLKVHSKEYFSRLANKKISAVAFDNIKDDNGVYPIVRSMSEIAGNTSILIAAELMNNYKIGKGLMLGGISGVAPTEVVVIGAGTVGEFATRSALGLGASVKVFDSSITKLQRLQISLGQRIFTSIIHPKVLQKALMRADVVIGAIRGKGRTPMIVTDKMVKTMKTGAVIVDISIDHGGCIETSELTSLSKPTFMKHDVIHYGVANIPSKVSRTATLLLSSIFMHYLLNIGKKGGIENFFKSDSGFKNGIYMYHGMLTNRHIGEWFNIPYTDINLLLF